MVSLQDTFYLAQLTHNNTFGLILDIVYETMPRDNLLNSACLDLFEFIRRDTIKPIITHVVEKYRDKLKAITYVDTFENLIQRYDQLQGNGAEADATLYSQDESTPSQRGPMNGQRWNGVREMDAAEEEYFNTSDDEDEVGKLVALSVFFDRTDPIASSGSKKIGPTNCLLPRPRIKQLRRLSWSTTRMMMMR